jgi:two-component system, chemotaxis family, CheB/CheR fusion protein
VIKGVVITLINIEKQVRKTDEKLRRFAVVLEDSNDAITVLGFDGRILAWNKGAEAMYGWNETEALKMDVWQVVPKEGQKELKALMDGIKKGGPVRSFKSRRKTKDGRIFEVWVTVTALTDKKGLPVEIATTERDLAWLSEG